MAVLKSDQLFDINVSSAQFTQQGVPDTSTGDLIKLGGTLGVGAFKGKKISDARTVGRTLLEEFTGSQELAQIEKRELDIASEEDNILVGPAGAGQDRNLTVRQLERLQEEKNKLQTDRLAVKQGIISESEYRVRAEKRYYELLSFSPGLRDELAAAMGEALGFDPRGQESKVTMSVRKAALKVADKVKNQRAQIITGLGLGDVGMSLDELVSTYWPVAARNQQNLAQLGMYEKMHSANELYNKDHEIQLLDELEQPSLFQMATFGGVNIATMSLEQLKGMSPEETLRMQRGLKDRRDFLIEQVNKITKRNPELSARRVESIQRRWKVVDDLLTLKAPQESAQNELNLLKNEMEIVTVLAAKGIQMAYPKIQALAALQLIFPVTDLLGAGSAAQGVVTDVLLGVSDNYDGIQNPDKGKTVDEVNQNVLKNSQTFYIQNKGKTTSSQITAISRVISAAANSAPGTLNDKSRQRLFAAVAEEGLLEEISKIDPVQANKIIAGVLKHQKALGTNYQTQFKNIIANSPFKRAGLTGESFTIDKTSAGWRIAIKPAVVSELNKVNTGPDRGGGSAGTPAKNKRDASLLKARGEFVQGGVNALLNELNKPLSMITNLVKSKAIVLEAGEDTIVDQVAFEMGLSTGLEAGPQLGDPQTVKATPKKDVSKPVVVPSEAAQELLELKKAFPEATLQEILQFISAPATE